MWTNLLKRPWNCPALCYTSFVLADQTNGHTWIVIPWDYSLIKSFITISRQTEPVCPKFDSFNWWEV